MDLRRGAFVLTLAALLAFAACGGSSGTDTTTPDVPDVSDPGPGDVPLPDTVEDTNRDLPPDSPDVPDTCTCSATDECCDGCAPKNEGGTCGTPALCQMPGHCQAGTCSAPTPVACPPADTCHTGEGTCNVATGNCEYAPKADGVPCEAVAGKDGSGYCLAAACIGFDACDHRTYDQPLGSACNFDGECLSGRCAAWGDDWVTYCTAPCGGDLAACPDGMACVRSGTEFLCRPLASTDTLPNDGSHEAFQVCNHDEDCAGGLCLGIDGKKFCTKDCDSGSGTASDAACGQCGGCRDNGDTLGFKYKFYCVPQGVLQVGQPCGMSGDCAKRFCQNGLCSEQCFVIEDLSSCPDNMECVPGVIASDPTIQVCVPKGESGHGFGEPCLGDYACKDGRKCIEVLGVATCTATCDDATPCADGTCTDTAGGKVCVPPALIGTATLGQACTEAFQCAGGLECFQGACLKGCQSPADCTDGTTCFPDAMVQATYCVPSCADGAACPPRMGCYQGSCVLTADGRIYTLGTCRLGADCETGTCIGGLCTDTCSATQPCEGSEAIEPVPYGECQPCNPALYGADCAPEGQFSMNECIQGIDGTYFCALDCTMNPACPVGTRCYSLGGYTSVCAPLSGSCTGTIACTTGGHCVRPASDGSLCSENAECAGGKCVSGFCRTGACTADADCGCVDLECVDSECVPSIAGAVDEVEPNDTLPAAQALAAGTYVVMAALMATSASPDVDLFKVSLQAGQALDVRTLPFCGVGIDTYLRLRDASGLIHDGWENDDVDPNGDYSSLLIGYVALQAEDVVIEVSQSQYVPGSAKFPYLLGVSVYDVAGNDQCGGATPLAPGANEGRLDNATNNYIAPSCTGYAALGKDQAYSVVVPAGKVVRASLDSAFDGQLYAVTDCANADTTCVAGADAVWEPGLEEILWWNRTGADTTLYVIVDSLLPTADMTFTLDVQVSDAPVPANDGPDPDGIPQPASPAAIQATTVGANDDYDPTAAGCGGVALPGADVVYLFVLADGWFATFNVTHSVGFAPVLWLTTDRADPTKCVAAGGSFVKFENTSGGPVPLYLIVDSAQADAVGDFDLAAEVGPASATFGPCDPATFVNACAAEGQPALVTCDQGKGVLAAVDCDGLCRENGADSGVCHAFTTPGYERSSCLCDYTCTAAAVDFQCSEGYYTNCTCGAADPCAWKADGFCNEFCAIEYPGDHFTDPVEDCPPAP